MRLKHNNKLKSKPAKRNIGFSKPLPTRRRKNIDNENDIENGLRTKNEVTMKEKRFSFFADPRERKAESRPTFGTLPFARYTSLSFAKVKEPNSPNALNFLQY